MSAAVYPHCCLSLSTFVTLYKHLSFALLAATTVKRLPQQHCQEPSVHHWVDLHLPLEKEAARLVFDEEYPQDEVQR